MLEFYLGFSMFLTVIGAFVLLVMLFLWAMDRSDINDRIYGRERALASTRRSARRVLIATGFPIYAWGWPLTIPLALLYTLSRVAKDASLPTD